MLLPPATDRTWFHYGFLNISEMHSLGNFFAEYYTGLYSTAYHVHSSYLKWIQQNSSKWFKSLISCSLHWQWLRVQLYTKFFVKPPDRGSLSQFTVLLMSFGKLSSIFNSSSKYTKCSESEDKASDRASELAPCTSLVGEIDTAEHFTTSMISFCSAQWSQKHKETPDGAKCEYQLLRYTAI